MIKRPFDVAGTGTDHSMVRAHRDRAPRFPHYDPDKIRVRS